MCGFAGFLDSSGTNSAHWPVLLDRMGEAIRHRGPDASGVWVAAQKVKALVVSIRTRQSLPICEIRQLDD